jgi:rare lipoprotein A
MNGPARVLALVAASALAACATTGPASGPRSADARAQAPPPADLDSIPDAVPRDEPLSKYGNPPAYEVFGRRYIVLSSAAGYLEQGIASWYGPGFHGKRTSTQEYYDMYAMTAAHRTLPIPSYARVTNLENGRSVVVRINDRGPFVGERIIDLSYAAAHRLDLLRKGTARVEVRAVATSLAGGTAPPTGTGTAAAARDSSSFVQVAAFSDPANAAQLVARLADAGLRNTRIDEATAAGGRVLRVSVGPVLSRLELDDLIERLALLGITGVQLPKQLECAARC